MAGDPLFSVVLTTYNRPSLLREAVGSVLAQTVTDFELVIVDDASAPPAEAIGDPRIRVIRLDPNVGLSGARNAGIRAAVGRYLAFIDDDDLYTSDRLALALEGLARAPVAICWSRFHDQPAGRHRTLEGAIADSVLDGPTPSLGATALRRDLAPCFDERWAAVEDVDWWLRVGAVLDVATVCRVGYLVRRHDGPRHGNDIAARLDENVALIPEHDEYFASHPAAAAYRWKRIGLLALSLGDRRRARAAFRRSLRLRPQLATVKHLIRSLGRSDRVASATGTVRSVPTR